MLNTAVIITLAVLATVLGGLLALRFSKHLHYFNAFAAGILLGAAFFEIIPESAELVGDFHNIAAVVVLGFLAFYVLQKFTIIHACRNNDHDEDATGHTHHVGIIGASGLAIHRFLDGAAVGLGFAVNEAVGLAIGMAVIAHGFGDGVSTVTVMLKHKNSKASTITLLSIGAIAPLIGALLGLYVTLPVFWLAMLLAFFAGMFLYLSTSDLLPEAHHDNHSYLILIATLAGAALLYLISQLIH